MATDYEVYEQCSYDEDPPPEGIGWKPFGVIGKLEHAEWGMAHHAVVYWRRKVPAPVEQFPGSPEELAARMAAAEDSPAKTPHCQSCWEREGRSCYSLKVHGEPLPRDADGRTPRITGANLARCLAVGAYRGKRAVLEQVIPTDQLVIASERTEDK